jgi:hypothetical protein
MVSDLVKKVTYSVVHCLVCEKECKTNNEDFVVVYGNITDFTVVL